MEKKMSAFVPLLLPVLTHLAKYGNSTAPNNDILTRTDTLYETPIQFDCVVGSHKGARWKFNEMLLFADDNAVGNTFRGSVFLLSNYSLRITSASFRHEGIFSCLKNSTTVAMYDLNILVAPDRLTMTINKQPTSSIVYVPQQEEFVAVCAVIGAKPAANITWLIDNEEADSSKVGPLEKNRNKEDDLLFDSTSRLRYVAKRKQRNITCISKSTPSVPDQHYHATFQTYVQPNMTILVNGLVPLDEVLYVPVREEVTLTCRVWNAERLKNLTWIIDDSPMDSNLNTRNISDKYEHLLIFRSQVFKLKVNATCVGIGHKSNVKVHSGITLFTYVKPKLLFMNKEGNISNDVITVNEHEKFNITCAALGARPPVDLIVKYNDDIELSSEKIIKNNSHGDDTFDSFAYVVNFPVKTKVKIFCITSGIDGKQDVYKAIDIVVDGSGKMTVKDNTFILASVFGGALLLLICIIILIGAIHLVRKASRTEIISQVPDTYRTAISQNSSTDSNSPERCFTRGNGELPLSHSKAEDVVAYERSIEIVENMNGNAETPLEENVSLPKTNIAYREIQPPSLQLPPVPNEADSEVYQSVPETCGEYYTEMKQSVPKGKIFHYKDMCFVLNVNNGPRYNRWMGTISLPKSVRKCVFITTISEYSQKTKEIHWDEYVKRVLQLPEASNVINVEGVCIDKDHLYLVNEHVDCETLEKYVIADPHENSFEPEEKIDVSNYIQDFLKGMEFIHSQGFLHPGLALKKILVTNKGACKLYDFILPEDVCSRIINKKTGGNVTLNHLPPEALQRNEYYTYSDCWCAAVIVWQMLTAVELVFPDYYHHGMDIEPIPTTKWKHHYSQTREDTLKKCWKLNPGLRPTIACLLSVFEEMIDEEETVPCISSKVDITQYETMHGGST